MKLLLLIFILISYTNLSAQDSTYITIKSGDIVQEGLSSAEMYYYPQFTKGVVFLKAAQRQRRK